MCLLKTVCGGASTNVVCMRQMNQACDHLADMDVQLRTSSLESAPESLGPQASVAWLLQLAQATKQARVAEVLRLFPVTESTICSMSLPRDGDLSARTTKILRPVQTRTHTVLGRRSRDGAARRLASLDQLESADAGVVECTRHANAGKAGGIRTCTLSVGRQ